jgi:hypothetical protein
MATLKEPNPSLNTMSDAEFSARISLLLSPRAYVALMVINILLVSIVLALIVSYVAGSNHPINMISELFGLGRYFLTTDEIGVMNLGEGLLSFAAVTGLYSMLAVIIHYWIKVKLAVISVGGREKFREIMAFPREVIVSQETNAISQAFSAEQWYEVHKACRRELDSAKAAMASKTLILHPAVEDRTKHSVQTLEQVCSTLNKHFPL